MKWIKQLFCKHNYEKTYSIHGDMIIMTGYKRSVWRCTKCKKHKFSNYLNKLK